MENDVAEVEKLIRRAFPAKVMSILNLAPAVLLEEQVLSLCDLIVVNEDEADALAGWLNCGASAKRSEEHTSELQSLMRISYAVFCLKKKNNKHELQSQYTNT